MLKKAKLHSFWNIQTIKVGTHSSLTSELTSVNVAVNPLIHVKKNCKSVNLTYYFSSFSNFMILVDYDIIYYFSLIFCKMLYIESRLRFTY